MDVLKKVVVLVAILSASVFMTGCGGDSADDGAADATPATGPSPGGPGGGRPGPGGGRPGPGGGPLGPG